MIEEHLGHGHSDSHMSMSSMGMDMGYGKGGSDSLTHMPSMGSELDVRDGMDSGLLSVDFGHPMSSYVYFCFWRDEFDTFEHPNRLMIDHTAHPTVMDVCNMIKAIFFPGELVSLSMMLQGSEDEYYEDDTSVVPTHRSSILIVKVSYDNSVPKTGSPAQLSRWIKEHKLPEFELMSKFLPHKITMQSLKYMKHSDLINIGVKEWGLRAEILRAIERTFSEGQLDHQIPAVQGGTPQGVYTPGPPVKRKNPVEADTSIMPPPKKAKKELVKNRKIRYKDLRSLVLDDLIPVDIGSKVRCAGSKVTGVVVKNKQKKPVIRYTLPNGKKKMGTISQYFKDATNTPLQAKGDSWSNIFFTHKPTGITRSLQGINYLMKGPKKVVSAFLYFAKEIRETLPPSGSDFAKKSGEIWRSLTPEQKQKYKFQESVDKVRFSKEKTEWSKISQQHLALMELHRKMKGSLEEEEIN
eukprot:TRINITY_DN2165_c0_g1_i2.p1 TRINITY_DN2165_c0_g1~~TRINITY_DN2165_c0_g1_i2.p1  ORF type:complete len:466 (-),score=98.13 TRINITY_DN2165_c0_g1_i2:38-1435(-)